MKKRICGWRRLVCQQHCFQSTSYAKDYYKILGVKRDATQEEIKSAFIELSKKHHPDAQSTSGNSDSGKKFLEIKEAYDALRSPMKRKEYDSRFGYCRSGNGRTNSNMSESSEGGSGGKTEYSQEDFHRMRSDTQKVRGARAGTFYNPTQEYERQEKDRKIFYASCAALASFILIVNLCYISFAKMKKLPSKNTKNSNEVLERLIQQGIWRMMQQNKEFQRATRDFNEYLRQARERSMKEQQVRREQRWRASAEDFMRRNPRAEVNWNLINKVLTLYVGIFVAAAFYQHLRWPKPNVYPSSQNEEKSAHDRIRDMINRPPRY